MSNFYVRGILAILVTLAILLACLFIPVGTLNYWLFVAVFEGSAQALGIYFLIRDTSSRNTLQHLVEPWRSGSRPGIERSSRCHAV
jgi:hypothetical protein